MVTRVDLHCDAVEQKHGIGVTWRASMPHCCHCDREETVEADPEFALHGACENLRGRRATKNYARVR